MELISKQTNIDFMGRRKLALVFSIILMTASIASLAINGLKFGLDFTGGTLIEVEYPQDADLVQIRDTLTGAGFGDAVVQTFGTPRDVLVRVAPRGEEESSADLSTEVITALQSSVSEVELRRVEYVGPQIGEELTEQGVLALFYALLGILIYIWVRFEIKFAVGAVAALAHDVLITIGIFSIFGLEFDLTVLAALLAVIGYSLNDTVVVYDRVRENFRTVRKHPEFDILNLSINQMLARTLMTSLTTLLVLTALFVFGGEIIHNFALALIVGVIIGTYSSIYIASSSLLALGVTRQDLMQVEKEGAELDRP